MTPSAAHPTPDTEAIRLEIQVEARRWIGTPYRHQHRVRNVAVDCIGLVIGVGEACGVYQLDAQAAAPFLRYSRHPNPRRMREALDRFFVPVGMDGQPGDFGLFAWDQDRAIGQHVGILAENRGVATIIHAESRIGKCVEHGFTAEWPQRLIGWWKFPGVPE